MNDDAEDLRDRFWHDWEFLVTMARRELAKKGLRRHDPTDLVLDVMTKIVQHVKEGRIDVATVRSWRALSTRYAQHEVLNLIDRGGKILTTPYSDELTPSSELTSSRLEQPAWERFDQEQRRELFGLLPDRLGRLMVLRYETGLSLSGAAAVLGVTPKAARQMIDNLRRKVDVVERGGVLRGEDRLALTRFAHAVRALRDERSGRA